MATNGSSWESGDFMKFVLNQKNHEDKESEILSHSRFRSLVADSVMLMVASSDTTAAALSSTMWFLLSHPLCLAKLRKEIKDSVPSVKCGDDSALDSILPYEQVKSLPYLWACIDETLRLRPPIAYQLPRLVSNPEGVMITGQQVKPRTVVAVPPYSVHRHPSLYPDPDT